jgi:hypothetical protein
MFWAALIPLLKAAGIGAAIGGGTAAASGGDVKKGALMGALSGGAGSGLGGLLGGVGGSTASAATNAGASALGSTTGGVAAGTATKVGLSELLKKAAVEQGMNAALSAATPQYGMTIPGQVPQMQENDPMVALQQLMQKSKLGGYPA